MGGGASKHLAVKEFSTSITGLKMLSTAASAAGADAQPRNYEVLQHRFRLMLIDGLSEMLKQNLLFAEDKYEMVQRGSQQLVRLRLKTEAFRLPSERAHRDVLFRLSRLLFPETFSELNSWTECEQHADCEFVTLYSTPLHPVTLSDGGRVALNVPVEATYFSFSYPASCGDRELLARKRREAKTARAFKDEELAYRFACSSKEGLLSTEHLNSGISEKLQEHFEEKSKQHEERLKERFKDGKHAHSHKHRHKSKYETTSVYSVDDFLEEENPDRQIAQIRLHRLELDMDDAAESVRHWESRLESINKDGESLQDLIQGEHWPKEYEAIIKWLTEGGFVCE